MTEQEPTNSMFSIAPETSLPSDVPHDLLMTAQAIHLRYVDFQINDVECVTEIARAILAERQRLAPSDAARDVLAERQRQIEVEGWNAAHDDQQPSDNLVMASVSYALASVGERTPFRLDRIMVKYWPWAFDWWKPKDRRRDKVRSAALMLAAIEHDDRTSAPSKEG